MRRWIQIAGNQQKQFLQRVQLQDQALRDAVAKASQDINRILRSVPDTGVGDLTRRLLYAERSADMRQVIAQLWGHDVPNTIMGEVSTTTQMAIRNNRAILERMLGTSPAAEAIRTESMRYSAAKAFQDLRSREMNKVDLSQSVYNNYTYSAGKIDDVINTGILAGKSASEIAANVTEYINPDVMGGVSYAAMRLGRTELNNAFHATSVQSYAESPYVDGVEWVLSESHPGEDDCDDFDGEVFAPENVPDKPHPNCFCYLIPVTPDVQTFADNLVAGEYDCG